MTLEIHDVVRDKRTKGWGREKRPKPAEIGRSPSRSIEIGTQPLGGGVMRPAGSGQGGRACLRWATCLQHAGPGPDDVRSGLPALRIQGLG